MGPTDLSSNVSNPLFASLGYADSVSKTTHTNGGGTNTLCCDHKVNHDPAMR